MSDIEVETPIPNEIVDIIPDKKVKKKRVLTEEQKQKLRDQLKKGRETALANRQKNGLVKKIKKKEAEEERDKTLVRDLLKIDSKDEEIDKLKNSITELREMVNGMKVKPVEPIKEPIKLVIEPEPEPEPIKKPLSPIVEVLSPPPPPPKSKVIFNTRKKGNNEFF